MQTKAQYTGLLELFSTPKCGIVSAKLICSGHGQTTWILNLQVTSSQALLIDFPPFLSNSNRSSALRPWTLKGRQDSKKDIYLSVFQKHCAGLGKLLFSLLVEGFQRKTEDCLYLFSITSSLKKAEKSRHFLRTKDK